MTNKFMQAALEQAQQALQVKEVPVGAIIVHQQKIIAQAHNLVETKQDPTAHAEILVLQQACRLLNNKYLTECDIYITLEPCAMCAYALSLAKIKTIYFGAFDSKSGAIMNGQRLYQNKQQHQPIIYQGLMQLESQQLLQNFFRNKRA